MSVTLTNITYGMTGKQVRDAMLANFNAIENYALGSGEAEITAITQGLSDSAFFSAINSKCSQLMARIYKTDSAHTTLSTSTNDVASVINANNALFSGYTDTFLTDGYPFWFKKKQLTITGVGTANILAQVDNWKLAWVTGGNTLYLSADNGDTWPYSKLFSQSPANLRLAHVFRNGDVLLGTVDNLLYSSQDLLTTINQVTCRDTNNDPITFHTPQNALYPGVYFGTSKTESYMVGDVEVLLWGNYPHNQSKGAAPIGIFYTDDGGATVTRIYEWGQNPNETDNGTALGGVGGTPLGDAGNELICKHFHYTVYDSTLNKFLTLWGDDNATVHWMEHTFNTTTKEWTFTNHPMGTLSGYFRNVGLRFYNNGANAIWGSDGNGNIYTVSYANLFTALANHTLVYDGTPLLGYMTAYDEVMFFTSPAAPPTITISMDTGATWKLAPANYRAFFGADTKLLNRLWDKDQNDWFLVHVTQVIYLDAAESYLLQIKPKPVY